MPRFTQRKWLVVALRTGRLANRIVLFANVIAFAEEHGCKVLNPAFQTYAALFESTRDTLLCPYPPPAPRRPSRGRNAVYGTLRFTRLLYHMAFRLSRPVNRIPGLAPWIRGIESPVGPHGVELTAPPVYGRSGRRASPCCGAGSSGTRPGSRDTPTGSAPTSRP